MSRRFSAPIVTMGSLSVAAAGFLPWGASGRRERSSYELLAVLDRLDVLDGPVAVAFKSWYLAPVAAGGVWLAFALGRRPLALTLAAVLAAGGTLLAVAARRSPLLPRPGPCATIAAAAVVGAGLALAGLERYRTHHHE